MSINGGKIADDKAKKWVKPLIITAIIGTVAGAAYWKKDEIMAAVNGKSKAVNGLNGTKKKGKKSTKGKGKKGLGNNKGLETMIEINQLAKSLQNKSGFETRKVKEVEVKTVSREMPKLRWNEAQKRAASLYRTNKK